MSKEEEIQEAFLKEVWKVIIIWQEHPTATLRQKLEGTVQGILEILEGIPSDYRPVAFKWILAPDPHPDDKQYCMDHGANYFAENCFLTFRGNISGSLARNLFKVELPQMKESAETKDDLHTNRN